MDRLKDIFEIQKSFTEKFFEKQGFSVNDIVNDKELKIKWNKEYVLALSKEVYEVLDEIDWKMHTSKDTEDVNDNVLEECVDVLKYLFGIIQLNGFSVDNLYDKFVDGFLRWLENEHNLKFNSLAKFKQEVDKKQQYKLKSEYRTCGVKATLNVLDGVKTFMKDACEKYNVVLLTARPYKKYFRIYSDTIKWLSDNDICYDAIVFDEEKEKYIINNFDPKQVAFCVDDDISNANKLHDSGFKVYLKKNLGIYTQEALDRKLNDGIQIVNGNIIEVIHNEG